LICAWHLQRHFTSKFSSLSRTNKDLYRETLNLPFIGKKTKFEDIIKRLKEDGVLSKDQLEYLNSKLEGKKLWAKSENLTHFVIGISTTSRIESMHAVLRKELNSNSRLGRVLEVFREIEDIEINKFKHEFERHKKNLN